MKGKGRHSLPMGSCVAALAGALTLVVLGTATGAGPPDDMGHESTGYVAPSALYTVDVAGDPARLTQLDPASGYLEWNDATADVDADGNIVFSSTMPAPSDDTTDAEIYLLQTDGTLVQLTDNTSAISEETGLEEPINDLNPVFSPDGSAIAYDSPPAASEEEAGGDGGEPTTTGLAGAQIWTMDLATKQPTQVTSFRASVGAARHATWSPSGTEIAFTLGDGRRSHIVRMDLATETMTDVTTENSHDANPAWHPTDPDLIAYTHRAGINADVSVKNIATGAATALADTSSLAESRPDWSPDGSLIAYQRGDESLGAAVWVMNADGTGKQAVTAPGLWADRNPAFADADTIVFDSTNGAPPVADLAISMTGQPATTIVGGSVVYTIPVVNNGVLTAPGVVVTDTLPAAMEYVSTAVTYATSEHGEETVTPAPVVDVAGNVVTVSLGDLAKSEHGGGGGGGGEAALPGATIAITATASQAGSFTNSAVVALTPAAGDPIVDPLATNDTATATTDVKPISSGPTILGTEGDDVIVGTPGDDVIWGLGGDDVIRGLDGRDRIVGGPGDDVLRGGSDADLLLGGRGADTLHGAKGGDRLRGESGADVLLGGRGTDDLKGGLVADRILGGPGADALYGNEGNDVIVGGDGNDFLNGGMGADHLYGYGGNDRLFALDGRHDQLIGGPGFDTASADAALDQLRGIERRR